MFYNWLELSDWINTTPFEIFMFIVSLYAFSILLTFKLCVVPLSELDISWWTVHSPLFIFDALSAYFCIIIFIRQNQAISFKEAIIRGFFSFKRIFLLFTFKMLLCLKLENQITINYSEAFLPLFYLIFVLMCRSFKLGS